MSSSLKILRVFLASPGDLGEERDAVRSAVTELNETSAADLGYHIELVGWEETPAAYGRPQDLINPALDRCHLFIGMVWRKWGTPPDTDGRFTSGFEEEFERSMSRREQSDSPDIALFFKEISKQLMEDPGDELKRVLAFRDQIIADKKILFQKFSTAYEMETLARKCIGAYVRRVASAEESSGPHKPGAERTGNDSKTGSQVSSPLLPEGFAFLKRLVDGMEQGHAIEDLTEADVARFRLLANSVSKPGNDDMDLGAHDLNILYLAHANGMPLGERELDCLARLGFHHLRFENVPLWHWYSSLPHPHKSVFLSSVAGANDDEIVGAIRVLDVLSIDLPTGPEPVTRKLLLDNWFSDESSTRVRSAALSYLTRMGTADDYAIVKREYDKSEPETSLRSLNCMLQILLRTGQPTSAPQLVLKSQVESLDSDTLATVLDGFENLEPTALLNGLDHRNPDVRRRSLQLLVARGSIDQKIVQQLCQDADASIRYASIAALSKLGRSLTEDEAKEILIRPQKSPLFGGLLGSTFPSDSEGEEHFARYRSDALRKLPETALTKHVDTSRGHDHDAFFTRAEKFFAKHGDELRRDVDDTFSGYFQERVRRMKNMLAGHPLRTKHY